MRETVKFLDKPWERVNKIQNLSRGYFLFYADEKGRTYLGVYTKEWIPNKTKCSPRNKKYYDKYLQKNVSHMSLWDQKMLVDNLIKLGYKHKSLCLNPLSQQ